MDLDIADQGHADHFYPEAFFIGCHAWHKFIAAVSDAFCNGDRFEAEMIVELLLYEIGCVPNVDVSFVDLTGEYAPFRYGPRTNCSSEDASDALSEWLSVANEFGISLVFGGDAQEARDRPPMPRSSRVEPVEQRAIENLGVTSAIRWFEALGLIGYKSNKLYYIAADACDRRWRDNHGQLAGGDVVQLFADLLNIGREEAACRVVTITDDLDGVLAPKSISKRTNEYIARVRAKEDANGKQ
jgi:hypothetical protein